MRAFSRRVAPAGAGADPYNCQPFNFTQRVDHFDRKNQRTFKQRYYLCDGLCAPGSRKPLFVYFGAHGVWDCMGPPASQRTSDWCDSNAMPVCCCAWCLFFLSAL